MPGETNIRILTCLGMYELTTVLRTRPPVGEEGEEVTVTHTAVAVERSKRPQADEDRGGDGCDASARPG